MGAPRICIVGAGISGLVLGRCLLRRGIQAVLFEKSRSTPTRNKYGITLYAAAYRPLLRLLDIEESYFRNKVAVDASIGGHGRIGSGKDSNEFRVNRARLEGFLAEGLDIRYEHRLETLEQLPNSTVLQFGNGSSYETQILVGADGVHSQTRKCVSPETDYKILPFVVFNGKRRVAPEDFSRNLQEYFKDRNIIEANLNGVLFQISIDDYESDKISISYNYSRPAREGEDPLYRPTRSKSDATNIPEAFFSEIDGHQLKEPYRTVFSSETMRGDRLLNWLMRTMQADEHVLREKASTGVVLIGEAAHAEPILGGHGAHQSIQDTIRLFEILVAKEDISKFYTDRFDQWRKSLHASEQRIHDMHKSLKTSL
ncbi:MAG: hypothetical protein GOMPHAMPRED_002049 [Gomphillus americanus]|uniref:FAD-binding domain-containing protein n=1 Tax=Gomphillus americanus TaxID=1940652 RepID=A0A8H3INM1_9LECA|nr:MAG: hypothetical protein GOMPHAMPRED_002049 [Gomphillus americanus]